MQLPFCFYVAVFIAFIAFIAFMMRLIRPIGLLSTTINILHDHFGIKEDPIRFFSRCLNRQLADFFAAFLLCNPFVFVRM
jgi:hypothetical protein